MQFAAGTVVYVEGAKKRGEIIEGPNRKGEYCVSYGSLSLWVAGKDLRVAKKKDSDERKQAVRASGGGREEEAKIDLHGLKVAEALRVLEQALDRALLQSAHRIEVVHGIGTGAVKTAVHACLKESRYVSRFEVDSSNPGTTWVYL